MTLLPRQNLKKQLRPMKFLATKKKDQNTINLVMLLLKEAKVLAEVE